MKFTPYYLPAWIADMLTWATWGSALLFAVLYTLKARWWQSPMGWNLFGFDLQIFLLLTPDILKMILHIHVRTRFYQWYSAAILLAVILFILHRTYLLMRAQKGWNSWGGNGEAHDNHDGRLDLRGEPAARLRSLRGLRERVVARLRADRSPEPERLPAADSSDSERGCHLP